MLPLVDTRQPEAVRLACMDCWKGLPGAPGEAFWRQGFRWLTEAFAGLNPRYEPLDTPYHDLEHTLQGTLCLSRLLAAWQRNRIEPRLEPRDVEWATLAILFHDTGYLKPRGDHSGTGAKFTRIHVQRSADFAALLLREAGYPPDAIAAVQGMIQCTGATADPASLPFASDLLRQLGTAVGTGDLLGQLAAPDYPERLHRLHREFLEAAAADPHPDSPRVPASLDAFIHSTPTFWERLALPRLTGPLRNRMQLLNTPWPDGPNACLDAIAANLSRIARHTPAS